MKKRGILLPGRKAQRAVDMLTYVMFQLLVIALLAVFLFTIAVQIVENKTFTKMYLAADTALLLDTISASPQNLRLLYSEPYPHTIAPKTEPPYAVVYDEENEQLFGFYPYTPVAGYTYELGAYAAPGILYTKEGNIIRTDELNEVTLFELLKETGTLTKKACPTLPTYDQGWLTHKIIAFDAFFTDTTSPALRQQAASVMESVSSQFSIYRDRNTPSEDDNFYFTMDVPGEVSRFQGDMQSKITELKGPLDPKRPDAPPRTDVLVIFRMTGKGSSLTVHAKPDSQESRKLGCLMLNQYNNLQNAEYVLQDADVSDALSPLLSAAKIALVIDVPQTTDSGEALSVQKFGRGIYKGMEEYFTSLSEMPPVEKVEITSPVQGSTYISKAPIPLDYLAKDGEGAAFPIENLKAAWFLDDKPVSPGALYALAPQTVGDHTLKLTVTGPDRSTAETEMSFTVSEGGYSILYVPVVVDESTESRIDAMHASLQAVIPDNCIKKNVLTKGCHALADYTILDQKKFDDTLPAFYARECLDYQKIDRNIFDLIIVVDDALQQSSSQKLFFRNKNIIVTSSSSTSDNLLAGFLGIDASKLSEKKELKCAT